MNEASGQILSVAQMRAAEEALISAGSSVDALMQVAGRGAAEWVWRIAARHPVTVLCGPGNNGGDGYVIAEVLRDRGCPVRVVAAAEPKTDAARHARALYRGDVLGPDPGGEGAVLVDCLFGSGLVRPLSGPHLALLRALHAGHRHRIAVDLPSGIEADSGAGLNERLPRFDMTLALGAWKFAHFLMPSRAICGMTRLVPIGCAEVPDAARAVSRPLLRRPRLRDNKFTRGLVTVLAGAMPGAATLAGMAALRGGAGYVKLASAQPLALPTDLVGIPLDHGQPLADPRNGALLVGPGLGRDRAAGDHLALALARASENHAAGLVVDADALQLLAPALRPSPSARLVLTPHAGEMAALEAAFGLDGGAGKVERAAALARALGACVVFKGADTVIAAADGRIACGPRAPGWLAMAGTGDVLAGLVAARLATGIDGFAAACEAVWLHGEAGWIAGPAFTASELAAAVPAALARAI